MAKAYPVELRERAVATVIAAREPQAEVAALFGVGLATRTRWLARWRQGQRLAAEQSRHGPPARLAAPASVSALRAQVTPRGLLEPMTVEGGTTIEVFASLLDRFLCPCLRPGHVVLLDNLLCAQKPGHHRQDRGHRRAGGVLAALQPGLPAH